MRPARAILALLVVAGLVDALLWLKVKQSPAADRAPWITAGGAVAVAIITLLGTTIHNWKGWTDQKGSELRDAVRRFVDAADKARQRMQAADLVKGTNGEPDARSKYEEAEAEYRAASTALSTLKQAHKIRKLARAVADRVPVGGGFEEARRQLLERARAID